jgi:hypothetical protein
MEHTFVVVTLHAKLDEVLACLGALFTPELDVQLTYHL